VESARAWMQWAAVALPRRAARHGEVLAEAGEEAGGPAVAGASGIYHLFDLIRLTKASLALASRAEGAALVHFDDDVLQPRAWSERAMFGRFGEAGDGLGFGVGGN